MLKLANWLIYLLVSANFVKNWTYQHPRNFTGPRSSSIEEHFLDLNYRQAVLARAWRMHLCSHRYVRIVWLLSVPFVLRTKDWLCILPAITLVVLTSPRNLTKLHPWTDWWWTAKTTRWKAVQAFPPGGMRGHYIHSTLLAPSTWVTWVTSLCVQCCIKAENTTFDPFDMSNMNKNQNC